MKESVKNMCDRFTEDFNTVKKDCGFVTLGHSFIPLCAFLFTANGKQLPDPQQIRTCTQMLKNAVGNSRCFGDAMISPTACLLSMRSDAEKLIDNSIADYQMIKNNYGIVNAKYHSLSALIMELMNRPDVREEKAAQSRELFGIMKKKYCTITGGEYAVLSMLLAYSGKSNEEILDEMECIYEQLKPVGDDFSGHVTALLLTYFDKPVSEKAEKLRALYDILAEHKPKYPGNTALMYLAVVSMFGDEPSAAAGNILEVFDELGERKGYKGFLATIDAGTRLLHAALIVMANYLAESGQEQGLYVPTLAAAFLPIMHIYDRNTAAIMAGTV